MKKTGNIFIILGLLILIASCHEQSPAQRIKTQKVQVKTTQVKHAFMPDIIEFTGKTVYLNKNAIVAPISGYITKVNIREGDRVKKNEALFEMMTSEAYTLMQSEEDTNASFYGSLKIVAPAAGIISGLKIVKNKVFTDQGNELCTIIISEDVKVKVQIPFEYARFASPGKICRIILPDSTSVMSAFTKILPMMDNISQTEEILADLKTKQFIPENMIVKVQVEKGKRTKTQILPRTCVMTDALMTRYWVVKLINDTTAVQIAVKTGRQTHTKTEILSPKFDLKDKFVSEGAYGLNDTSFVEIVNQ